jgi:hypothetical protein
MEQLALEKIAFNRHAIRDDFPFGLGRQPRVGPARECIRLVPAHVTDGGLRIERALTGERELRIVRLRPVEGLRPFLGLDRRPAIRHPELRSLVTAAANELAELGIGDQALRDRERLQVDAVPRRLVVEAELPARVPDLVDAFGICME